MNIYEANMFDSRKLNLRLFIDAMKLDKQLTGSYSLISSDNAIIKVLLDNMVARERMWEYWYSILY